MPSTTKAITAANTYSDALDVGPFGPYFNVSVWGTFSATATLQRSFDNGTTWLDVASYNVPVEDFGIEPEGAIYRIGVKTGGYTSGTINVRIGA